MLRGRIGSTVTITNYTDDGTVDKHGDPERTVDTTTSDVPALLRQPTQRSATDQDNPAGSDVTFDANIYVPDEYDVHESGAADGSGGSYRYSTRLTDDETGKSYDVVDVWDEKNGTYRCAVKEV